MSTTFGALLNAARDQLREAGIDTPAREARLLAQHAFEMSAAEIISSEHEPAPLGSRRGAFASFVKRRAAHEPFAHIIGETEFYGLSLLTDERALVPRADSEGVVDRVLELLPETFAGTVADLGTGSGCLLLSVLSQRAGATGIGLDASSRAISLADENAVRTGLLDRVKFHRSNWEEWQGWPEVDLVLSNPPYIRTSVIDTLAVDVKSFDPISALDGGADGLDAYRSIFACSANMKHGAYLVLEIGYDQSNAVGELAAAHQLEFVSLGHDLAGHPRVLTFQKSSTE